MGLKPEYPRLLSGLPADLSTKLFTNAKPVQLSAGKMLFRAGASDDGCYRVEDGLLKVTIVSGSRAERILAFLGQGAIVGELSIIDGLPRDDGARCHTELPKPGRVRGFCAETFRGLRIAGQASGSATAGDRHDGRSRKLAQRQVRPNDARAGGTFWARSRAHQKIGQNDLAAMAGIAHENVTRVLNDWQRHKILSRLSSYYCIENKAQLENQVKL